MKPDAAGGEITDSRGLASHRLGRLDAALILGLGLLARVPLVLAHPGIFGGDSVLRMARSDSLLLGHWLPLPQLFVFLTRALAPDPVWTRLVFAVAGSLAGVALAWVVTATAGDSSGRAAGVLFALHPFLVYYSLVPYQEGPMLLFLLAGAGALLHGKELPAGLALGLACLCRYEAWMAAALAAATRWRRPVRALLLFGWAPLAWVVWRRGVAPAGSYVLDIDRAASRVDRLPFLFSKLHEYSGHALFALAFLGVIVALKRRPKGWSWGVVFVILFLAAQWAVGHEHPPGSGRVSERMAHVPAVVLCILAGLALGALGEKLAWRRLPVGLALAAAIMAGLGLHWTRRAEGLVLAAEQDPSLRLAVDVARWAHERLPPQGRLAVAAPLVPSEAIQDYVRKIEATGGDVGRARANAVELAERSPDRDRIAAHLPRPTTTVVPAGRGATDLIVVFDDAPEGTALPSGPLVARFAAGGRAVSIYLARNEPSP